MKKAAIVLLSIASVAGLASVANAIPFRANEVAHDQGLGNLARSSGFAVNEVARGVGLSHWARESGSTAFRSTGHSHAFKSGSSTGSLGSLTAGRTSLSAVPEGGPSVLLLGAGLIALSLFRRHVQRSR
jgi:hypothetical protein